MTRAEFIQLMDEEYSEIAAINQVKGHDYSGDEDALSNFKRQAEALGLTPMQVLAVYFMKHVDAFMTYAKEGDVKSEPVEGRIHDIILYMFLALGLINDTQK